ncbi:putative small metal-binding protein [Paraburkholderia sp. RAU6.4a]
MTERICGAKGAIVTPRAARGKRRHTLSNCARYWQIGGYSPGDRARSPQTGKYWIQSFSRPLRIAFSAWLVPHATYTFQTSSIGRRSRRSSRQSPITSLATQPLRRASLPRAGSRREAPVESVEESIVWFKEIAMTRKYIDCREFPSETNCTVALSADSDGELLEAAVQHAVSVHQHADSPELREQLKTLFHEGTPPVEAPHA